MGGGVISSLSGNLYGQQTTSQQILNYKLDDHTFIFDEELNLNTWDMIGQFRSLLHLGNGDSMCYTSIMTDTSQLFAIYKFYQTHNGHLVDGASMIFAERGGRLQTINTNTVKSIPNMSVSITESTAITKAISHLDSIFPSIIYKWEDNFETQFLRDSREDSTLTYQPLNKGLLYTFKTSIGNPADYKLVYKIYLPVAGLNSYYVYVNASNGTILRKEIAEDGLGCGYVGTANVLHYGSVSFGTKKRLSNYRLHDCPDEKGSIITLWGYKHGFTYEIEDGNNEWGIDDRHGTTCHYSTSSARDFFYDTWGRKSPNNDEDHKLYIEVDWVRSRDILNTPVYNTSKYNHEHKQISIGRRESDGTTLGTLDLVGHEYTHAIIRNTSNLRSNSDTSMTFESGALNESFCDIFGKLVEQYRLGTMDWVVGNSVLPIRSLSNPNTFGHPNSYLQSGYWQTHNSNGIFSYVNAGVQNHWFYKLVGKIGLDKAKRIAYRTMAGYLTEDANYMESRNMSIQAAKSMYGNCSFEVNSTIEAWAEVGLGTTADADYECANITGPGHTFCNNIAIRAVSHVFKITTPSSGVTGYAFTGIPSSAVYTISGNTLTVTKWNTTSPINIQGIIYRSGLPAILKLYSISFRDCSNIVPLYPDLFTIDPGGRSFPMRPQETIVKEEGISIYPNPTNGIVYINLQKYENAKITVIDIYGRVLIQKEIAYQDTLNFQHLAKGVYLIKINTGIKEFVEKIVLQ